MKTRINNDDHFAHVLYPRLAHYFDLKEHKAVARYLRCKSIPTSYSIEDSAQTLWELHANLQDTFDQFPTYSLLKPDQTSFLDLKVELANRMLSCI